MANIFQKIKRKHKRKKMMAQKARKQTEDDYQTKLTHHRHAVLKRTLLTGTAVVVAIGLIVFYVEKSLTESGHGIFLREIATDMRAPIRHRRKRCVQVPLGSGLREMQAILAKSWKSLISGMQKERWRQRILSAQTGYCMRRLSCVKQSVCRYFGSSCLFLKLDDCETRKNLN